MRPGLNAGVTDRLLDSPENAAFVSALLYEGRIEVVDGRSEPVREVVAQKPAALPKTLSRLTLAALPVRAVFALGREHDIETADRNVDDVRLDIAEKLFG